MAAASFDAFQRGQASAFVSGTGIGTLAGLIGLGGAEFRLPFLISMFRFGALEAVIINKAMSLVVVASALPFRTGTTSVAAIAGQWPVIVNLLAGSLLGAWFGARYSRDSSFAVLRRNGRFAAAMAVGSVVGSYIGAKLLGIVPGSVLLPILAAILLLSSVKLWRHRRF